MVAIFNECSRSIPSVPGVTCRLGVRPEPAMPEPEPIDQSLAALSNFFVGGATLQQTLDRVVSHAETAVPHAAMTGITMMVDGKPATASFTNPEAPEIDTAQYKTSRGPCLEAFLTRQVIIVNDTHSDDRWREFCRSASDHGVRSTLSLPMAVNEEPTGALNFYSLEP